jgi:5'-methylthioadenosine phosphorylase
VTLGIIGGSGIASLPFESAREREAKTSFGNVVVTSGKLGGVEAAFVPRHGPAHTPPHRIDYRAHVRALADAGATRVIGLSAAGSLSLKYPPGFLVLPTQFIDLVQDPWTFSDDRAVHADMTYPFCGEMRGLLKSAGDEEDKKVAEGGTYARTRGPQFETAGEVDMLLHLGAHLAGMTVTPEAKLFRELAICYQPLCMVVNWAPGISEDAVTHEGTLRGVEESRSRVESLLARAAPALARIGEHVHGPPGPRAPIGSSRMK